jgi:hypothetical protein
MTSTFSLLCCLDSELIYFHISLLGLNRGGRSGWFVIDPRLSLFPASLVFGVGIFSSRITAGYSDTSTGDIPMPLHFFSQLRQELWATLICPIFSEDPRLQCIRLAEGLGLTGFLHSCTGGTLPVTVFSLGPRSIALSLCRPSILGTGPIQPLSSV